MSRREAEAIAEARGRLLPFHGAQEATEAIAGTSGTPHADWLDLAACSDCVVWIANGDKSGMTDPADFLRRFAANTDWIELFAPCGDEDNDGWFSRHDCDTCGATAGQRYIVHALAR